MRLVRILVPPPGTEFRLSAVKVQSPNHWTAKEFHVSFFFYWSIVDLQSCVNYFCRAKWRLYIHSLSSSFPLWFITRYWIYVPVLYVMILLFIHSVYTGLYMLIPNSQSVSLPPPSPFATTSLFSVSLILFLFHRQVHMCHILDST